VLTRLKVNGFKNLVDVDVRFGPFTCIAGVNGVGKSNLFDAILFLAALADMPLLDAALSVRSSESGRASDPRSIFYRGPGGVTEEMELEAEMLVPQSGVDDLGQPARAAISFLRYRLTLGMESSALKIRREELSYINVGDAAKHLLFPHKPAWRKSVVTGRRTAPFISTSREAGTTFILLHQDLGEGYQGGGRPRPHVADKLPRTVLSNVNAAENSTAVLARREMQSWRLLQLEPSALRSPDTYTAPQAIAPNGAHLPATLERLARLNLRRSLESSPGLDAQAEAVYARIANRLAELIDGVHSLRVDTDDRRELLTLLLRDLDGTEHEARSLSDGTLRFLALAVLESDPDARGVLCMEEPENGIHPQRVPAMLRLLDDLAVDPLIPVDNDNPLRQVIVNTHSPAVAAQVPEEALLVAMRRTFELGGKRCTVPAFRWLPDTWRSKADGGVPTVPLGQVVAYLNPVEPAPDAIPPERQRQRVVDREDLQAWLPFAPSSIAS
jgi:predicted ATPase